jgi:hypothetical protein
MKNSTEITLFFVFLFSMGIQMQCCFGQYNQLITYYIPSAKFFIGNFFANERKHP